MPRILSSDLLRFNFFGKHIAIVIILCFPVVTFPQFPGFFTLNDENGLPSNEVYSLVQDKNGFVWLGCDAGLYKFNGVRYNGYKCISQKSKSITGLTLSSSGRLYCYNFRGQIFYIENDTLKELKHTYTNIPNISCDYAGNLYVDHSEGIALFNEKKCQWTNFSTFDLNQKEKLTLYTKSVRPRKDNNVYFVTQYGIGGIIKNKLHIYPSNFFGDNQAGNFILQCLNDEVWTFSADGKSVYYLKNNDTKPYTGVKLKSLIANRKITNVRAMPDNSLWISTYTGLIYFNPATDSVKLLYPFLSFSDCMLDRENNYWLSTLQSGIIRIPELNYTVWNLNNKQLPNDKITKVAAGETEVFFATVNGYVACLNLETNNIDVYHTGSYADVQSLYYHQPSQTLFFYINNTLYTLKNKQLNVLKEKVVPVKAMLKTDKQFLLASSFGSYFLNENEISIISPGWTRDIAYDHISNAYWFATDKGLFKYTSTDQHLIKSDSLYPETQILGVNYSLENNCVYTISFDGVITRVNNQAVSTVLAQLPTNIQAYKIQYYDNKLYTATNKGLWILDITTGKWEVIARSGGLASDNIQSVAITNNAVWLATGRGLQKLPVQESLDRPKAMLQLKKLKAGGNITSTFNSIHLTYGQPLVLFPEASIYSSDGNFNYAYRIKNIDSNWSLLPGNAEQISITNIPSGDFEIELKAIDHLGRDSQNTIVINGYVKPPFWKSTAFFILLLILLPAIVLVILGLRIKSLRKKQQKEIERLNLENELRLTQQTALKAQMNPHFIFNVLNSIKGYIYKNDKQNAATYLGNFSDLIRNVLEMSSLPYTTLTDELKLLELYINLEGMMLNEDFSYNISIDDSVDINNTKMPPLLIQPYIENSFKHGLRHKQGSKILSLKILSSEDDSLLVEIFDNGIGRSASGEINKQRQVNYRSFATGAIERRIELINKEGKIHVTVKIEDLFNPTGTKVLIKLLVK